MANTTTHKYSLAHALFLISGILLVIYYLLSEGVPSLGNDITSLMKFIAEIFVLVVLIGFYFYFLFGAQNCQGTIKSIAPSLLILIVVGSYSMNFGNAEANAIISGIAKMLFTLIIACGFVFLFVHSKLLGLVFAWSSILYCAFVLLSYVIVLIITLVNGGGFSGAKLAETMFYVASLGLLFGGSYTLCKNKDWAF